jgi:hypothetical protein
VLLVLLVLLQGALGVGNTNTPQEECQKDVDDS